MFAVVVSLILAPGAGTQFMPLVQKNAASSLANEEGCHLFDVASDPARPEDVFLYELYTDEAAFRVHLASAHFEQFDRATVDMIASKDVRTYNEVYRP
ncbi:MAG: putative quinol monooxygenase [Pseudomonadota bacterium]